MERHKHYNLTLKEVFRYSGYVLYHSLRIFMLSVFGLLLAEVYYNASFIIVVGIILAVGLLIFIFRKNLSEHIPKGYRVYSPNPKVRGIIFASISLIGLIGSPILYYYNVFDNASLILIILSSTMVFGSLFLMGLAHGDILNKSNVSFPKTRLVSTWVAGERINQINKSTTNMNPKQNRIIQAIVIFASALIVALSLYLNALSHRYIKLSEYEVFDQWKKQTLLTEQYYYSQ